MTLVGLDILERHLKGELFQIKAVFNERGCVFGPVERQHLELSGEGISYSPDGRGNSLAAMIYDLKFEIRADRKFSESRTKRIIADIIAATKTQLPDSLPTSLTQFRITYGGTEIKL